MATEVYDANSDLTVDQAAAVAQRTGITIRRWYDSGRLPGRLVLRRLIIRRADLEKFLEEDKRGGEKRIEV